MLSRYLEHSIRFLLLVLIQVFLLNNIHLGGFITPYIYVLFLLSLPLDAAPAVTLFLGFLLGFTVDLFMRTFGMHAMACVAIAFLRPHVLRYIEPRDGYEVGMRASLTQFGWSWYLSYAALLVFAHHLILFVVEAFAIRELGYILLKTVLSGLVTLLLILIVQLISSNRRQSVERL